MVALAYDIQKILSDHGRLFPFSFSLFPFSFAFAFAFLNPFLNWPRSKKGNRVLIAVLAGIKLKAKPMSCCGGAKSLMEFQRRVRYSRQSRVRYLRFQDESRCNSVVAEKKRKKKRKKEKKKQRIIG